VTWVRPRMSSKADTTRRAKMPHYFPPRPEGYVETPIPISYPTLREMTVKDDGSEHSERRIAAGRGFW
jgi:hypothetical protein